MEPQFQVDGSHLARRYAGSGRQWTTHIRREHDEIREQFGNMAKGPCVVAHLDARGEAPTTPEYYNELGVRKYDLPALVRRIRTHFRGPSRVSPLRSFVVTAP